MHPYPVDTRRTMPLRALFAAALAALLPAVAIAADPARGRALYETACIGCHGRSVHARSQKGVHDCDELRATVARFANMQGQNWDADDLDDVAAWLNLRYYGFPITDERCRLGPATERTPSAAAR